MQDTKISRSLSQNLQYLRLSFGASGDFYAKELTICGVPCAIVMFTGLSSPESFATLRWTCWIMIFSSLTAAKGCVITCSHKAALRRNPGRYLTGKLL